ncbi:MAG: fucose isomerase [Clostridia bacterium]|nr:fucose isomerase [Clostridia bacterium]MBQ2939480.1 fucose isomerase [Clostridia bacterium]
MLKNIPAILSPELLKVLCEMGHSDRLVIADGNFPAESIGKNAIVIRADGHSATAMLDAILTVFPLDTYVEKPVNLMQVMPGDKVETPIWDEYKAIIAKHDERGADTVGDIERFEFYRQAREAYAIIATSEKALYANVMLQKGVI